MNELDRLHQIQYVDNTQTKFRAENWKFFKELVYEYRKFQRWYFE